MHMDKASAMLHFLKAISLSKQHGIPKEEALANERARMFCLQGKSTGTSSGFNFFSAIVLLLSKVGLSPKDAPPQGKIS